jgi:hypothetical protein
MSADDLLRAVGREMERRNFDSEVAQNVAKEFKNAGVAFAEAPSPLCLNLNCKPCTPSDGFNCNPCTAPCTDHERVKANCAAKPDEAECGDCCQDQYTDCHSKCLPGALGYFCRTGCDLAKLQCVQGCQPA